MSIMLRVELSEGPMTALRVRVQREEAGIDYGWVRLDELPHLIAAMIPPEGSGQEPVVQ